jgi:hypothetical protein
MQAGAGVTSEWDWMSRDVEDDIATIIDSTRARHRPLWLHLRGRRRVGKSGTIVRILSAKGYYLPELFAKLPVSHEEELAVLKMLYQCSGAADVRGAVDILERHVRSGWYLVFHGIQHASLFFQSALQAMIGRIERDYGVASVGVRGEVGGIIIMGSNSVEVDKVLNGTGAPLFGRFLDSFRILPLLPHEMSAVYDKFGITSAHTKLVLWLFTGCYPALLKRMCEIGELKNTPNILNIYRNLTKEDVAPLMDFEESKDFSSAWRATAMGALGTAREQILKDLEGTVSDADFPAGRWELPTIAEANTLLDSILEPFMARVITEVLSSRFGSSNPVIPAWRYSDGTHTTRID